MRACALGTSAAGSVAVSLVAVLKPTSVGAYVFFAAWLAIPYIAIVAGLVLLERAGRASGYWCVVAVAGSVVGVVFLADVIYWHRDAQGGIAVLMAPIFQGGLLIVMAPVAWWMSKKRGA